MMLIDCPFCGPRDETEFSCGGEAHIARPLAENKISDAEFADYLFMRDNPKGLFLERWRHSAGCRRWFNMARDTVATILLKSIRWAPCQKQPRQNLPIAQLAPRYCRRTCRQASPGHQKNAGKARGAK